MLATSLKMPPRSGSRLLPIPSQDRPRTDLDKLTTWNITNDQKWLLR